MIEQIREEQRERERGSVCVCVCECMFAGFGIGLINCLHLLFYPPSVDTSAMAALSSGPVSKSRKGVRGAKEQADNTQG